MSPDRPDAHLPTPSKPLSRRRLSNRFFLTLLVGSGGVYPLVVATMLVCGVLFPRNVTLWSPWSDPAIRYSAYLSLVTSLVAGVLSLGLGVPCGYLLSRYRIPGWRLLDILLYLPIVLPPLVLGVGLLIFFQTALGSFIERFLLRFTFSIPGIVLAQTIVGTAFSIRIAKLAFDAVSPKRSGVARTLGATRWQAFWHVEMWEARGGLVEAFVLAWATAFGAFGPIILFCGTTRLRTEVLSTSIFLEFSIGNLDKALVLCIWMGVVAALVLLVVRGRGGKPLW